MTQLLHLLGVIWAI